MKLTKLFALVLALLVFSGCAANTTPETTESTPKETTQPQLTAAPDFTVYTLDGEPVKLSDYIGQPVVLNFWASWCGPCKSEMPDFQQVYTEQGHSVAFLIVNLTDGSRETLDSASAFIDQQGYTFPVFYDTQLEAANTYGISSIPTTFFIDKDGYLIAKATGAMDGASLRRGIDMIVGNTGEIK